MEVQIGEVSHPFYDEVEGVPDNLPKKSDKPEERKLDSIISIAHKIEGEPGLDWNRRPSELIVQRELPARSFHPVKIVVRIIDCVTRFCCCCCRRSPRLPKEQLDIVDENGTTPVFRAFRERNIDKVYQLVDQGSNLSLSREHSTGLSFFHLATYFPELIQYLIQKGKMHGIDINSFQDNNGSTPIGYAILCSQQVDDVQISKDFISSAAILIGNQGRLDLPISNANGNLTILHYMLQRKMETSFKRPREDLNSVQGMGMSPLCYVLYMMWEESNTGKNSAIYKKNADCLFKVNAKIIYTNEGIPPQLQEGFRQFVMAKGFGAALNVDEAAAD